MNRSVLLAESNKKTRELLLKLLMEIDPELRLYIANNIETAYKYAHQCSIHLFLLDTVMDNSDKTDVSGIVFARDMRKLKQYRTTPIIFISALEDPKLYAYSELHCYQYIEKPFDMDKTVNKIREALGIETEEYDRRICFRKDGLLFPVKISEIIFIVFEKPVIKIYKTNGMLEIHYQPIQKILYKLNSQDFVQCNRNAVVNINYIENIDTTNRFLKMKNSENMLTLGDVYKRRLMRNFEND